MHPKYDFQVTVLFWIETTHGQALQSHFSRVDTTNKMLLVTLAQLCMHRVRDFEVKTFICPSYVSMEFQKSTDTDLFGLTLASQEDIWAYYNDDKLFNSRYS